MSAEDRLRYYATVFDTVEINSSYYAIPAARNAALWVERTPPGFLFNIKAYALMTGHHPRRESLPAELQVQLPPSPRTTRRGEIHQSAFPPAALDQCFRLYRAAIDPLVAAGKLGYVLFQLAPWVRFSDRALQYVTSLPARLPGLTIAVEFRDRSWLPDHADETLAALGRAGLVHAVVDGPVAAGAVPRSPAVTARVALLRLHGRHAEGWLRQVRGEEPTVREKYDYLYTEQELRELLPEVDQMAEESERVFISFNNNNRDYPVRNALMMRALLRPDRSRESLPPGDSS